MILYRRRAKRRLKRAIFIIAIIILGYFVWQLVFFSIGIVSSGSKTLGLSTNSPSPSPSVEMSKSLAEVVQKSMEGTKGDYAIYIKDLNTGERFALNEEKSYKTGSLYKLWVMATAYQKIEKGELKPDQRLEEDVVTLNRDFNIDPEYAEQKEGVISYYIKDALKQMITISHNYAALILTKTIKLSNVAIFLAANNFRDSRVGGDGSAPVSTASDIVSFYEKLYSGKLANPENTAEMLELLKKQQLNEKLPKYLPTDAVVAHKTGELEYFSHDAGIIYSPKSTYIMVVLSESTSPAGANERIAELSKAVYDYMQRSKNERG